MRSRYILALFLFFLSAQIFATEHSIHSELKLKPGNLETIGQSSDSCAGGPFQVMGEKGEEVLMVGSVLTFPLKGETTMTEGCKDVSEVKILSQKIIYKQTISECPLKNKKLESIVEETLIINGSNLTYERSSNGSKSRCVFKWTAN